MSHVALHDEFVPEEAGTDRFINAQFYTVRKTHRLLVLTQTSPSEGENQGGYRIGNLLYCPAGLNVTSFMNAVQRSQADRPVAPPRSDPEGLVHRQEVLVWLLKS